MKINLAIHQVITLHAPRPGLGLDRDPDPLSSPCSITSVSECEDGDEIEDEFECTFLR